MTTTATSNLGWLKPDVGTELDSWGVLLNNIFDAIDADLGAADTQLTLALASAAPSSPTDTGVAGQITWDANYIYVCISTNTWRAIPFTAVGNSNAGIVGETRIITHTTVPTGWLAETGQAINRTTYSALNSLYSAMGYPYGSGDGSTTFNLRDMRDRMNIGSGTTYSLGDTGGAATHTLTEDEMPEHTHAAQLKGTSASADGTSVNNGTLAESFSDAWLEGAGSFDSTARSGSIVVDNTGSGDAHNNLPPYSAGLSIVCVSGLAPI